MNKEQYLLELISKGYSDEDITILLSVKYPEENPLPTPAPSTTVTLQQSLDRTVATIKKVNEIKADKSFESIKDISSATTGAEMYALLEIGKSYNWKGSILYCFDKQPTQAGVRGFGLTPGKDYAVIGKWIPNTTDAISLVIPGDLDRLSIFNPTHDEHAANKGYVDGQFNKTMTVTFKDGTTGTYKLKG